MSLKYMCHDPSRVRHGHRRSRRRGGVVSNGGTFGVDLGHGDAGVGEAGVVAPV